MQWKASKCGNFNESGKQVSVVILMNRMVTQVESLKAVTQVKVGKFFEKWWI